MEITILIEISRVFTWLSLFIGREVDLVEAAGWMLSSYMVKI
jgi:hypothetical protein